MHRFLAILILTFTPFLPMWATPSGSPDTIAKASMSEEIWDLPAASLSGAPEFSDHTGQPAILILFQPHCPWCLAQFKEAEAFQKDHPHFSVGAISLTGSKRDLINELRQARTRIPAWRSSPALIKALGRPEGTPRVFVISENGAMIMSVRGLQSADALSVLIKSLFEQD